MSQLKQRLNTLRKQTSGSPPAIMFASELPSVAERISRAQLKQKQMQAERLNEAQLAELLQAEVHSPGLIVKETTLPLDTSHGNIFLNEILHYQSSDVQFTKNYNVENLLFLDTETTGLAGGTGTLVFLLGLARIQGDKIKLRQYLLSGFSGEKAMLKHAMDWIDDQSVLVTFNGKSFDLPLLNSRYRLMRIKTPFCEQHHIDLMHPMRRAFSNKWPDCRLQTAERRLLNFHRVDDMPGSEAPEAWFDWVRMQQHKRLVGIMEHNYWDVLSMVAMLPSLAREYSDPDPSKIDVLSIARGYLAKGETDQAYQLLLSHEKNLTHQGMLTLARLHRQHQQWQAAVEIWLGLSDTNCLESIENLAKYYEHRAKDLRLAQESVMRLVELDTRNKCHIYRQKRITEKITLSKASGI